MLIEEIINEKEFGLMSRGKAAVANFGRSALGKMGSTKMHNKALKGNLPEDDLDWSKTSFFITLLIFFY